MMRRISMAAAIAAALAAQAPSGALAGKANDTMNIAWQFIVENPDNYFNTSREGILIARMVWDNLIERDPVTNEYKPMLATAWKWVDDLTLEFDIRSGVKWHDGAPLTADDVIFTFNWISNPENKVLNQSNVSWIKEATKIGDNKVRVSAKHPFPAALEFIAGPLVIYPKHYYEKAGPQGMSRQTVGSGPYKLVRHDPGKAMLFERNDAYWDGSPRGKGKVAKINARFIPEVTTQIAEVISGGLDWMWYVPPDQVEKLGRLPNVGVTAGETMRVGYLYLDAAGRSNPNSPLKDVRVRRAIAHAINRLEFVKSMFGGEARVIDAPCFPQQFGCSQAVTKYDFDVDKAKKLLAEAGFANGFDIDFYSFRSRQMSDALTGYLRAVGIRATITHLQYPAFRDKNHSGVTPISHGDWGSYSIMDVSAILPNFFAGSKDDFAMDKEIQDWLAAGGSTSDVNKRKDVYAKAIAKITDQMYWLPMNTYNVFYAHSKDLDFKPFKDEIPRYYLYGWK